MHSIFIIATIIVLTGCNLVESKKTHLSTKDSVIFEIDTTLSQKDRNVKSAFSDTYDSLARTPFDTSKLLGKRGWLMNQFLLENGLVSPDYDTLFDLTYDGLDDYIIGYYGKSGTGIKNSINVYLYNQKRHTYMFDEQLSKLPNPTFYIKQKKITGFYIGNGGGYGQRLEWINKKWTMTMEFEVDKDGDTAKWNINNLLKNKKEVLVRPFQMIPPKEILETDIKW